MVKRAPRMKPGWQSYALIGFLIAVGLNWMVSRFEYAAKKAAPATNWFEVTQFQIADTVLGIEPIMVYERNIKQPFSGRWYSVIEQLTSEGVSLLGGECDFNEWHNYDPARVVPPGATLSWLTGIKFAERPGEGGCFLSFGTYRVRLKWDIEPPGYPPKTYTVASNPFRVIDIAAAAEQQKLIQEQVQ